MRARRRGVPHNAGGMLLTITYTQPPATDLGYLLHKNPAKWQSFELAFGKAHVFYPEAAPDRCTAALLLYVDPVSLVRNRRGPPARPARWSSPSTVAPTDLQEAGHSGLNRQLRVHK